MRQRAQKIFYWVVALLGVCGLSGLAYWQGQRSSLKTAPVVLAPAGESTNRTSAGGGGNATAGNALNAGGPNKNTPVAVEVVTVSKQTISRAISAVGSLRSSESVQIRSEVAGRIAVLGFKEGESVRKGQLLVRLDSAIQQAEVAQARANVQLANSNALRARDLQTKGFFSQQARDQAESNLNVAQATLAAAEARLQRMEIRAPFTGTVGLRNVSVGDYIKDGQDLINIEALDTLKVDFRVPERYAEQVRVGQTLELQLDALPQQRIIGKVIAINPQVDPAGRSLAIRAQVPNQKGELRPGMFARVQLLLSEQQEALVVPEQAIVPQGDEHIVFTVVENKAVRTKVQIGQRQSGWVEIVKGLRLGEIVVSAGQMKIRDGAALKLPGQTSADPSPRK